MSSFLGCIFPLTRYSACPPLYQSVLLSIINSSFEIYSNVSCRQPTQSSLSPTACLSSTRDGHLFVVHSLFFRWNLYTSFMWYTCKGLCHSHWKYLGSIACRSYLAMWRSKVNLQEPVHFHCVVWGISITSSSSAAGTLPAELLLLALLEMFLITWRP